AVAQQEGGFGQVVLRRERLHRRVRRKLVERHHRRGIALEASGGEGIELVEGATHAVILPHRWLPQNLPIGSSSEAISSGVASRPSTALRCGNRPKRSMMR